MDDADRWLQENDRLSTGDADAALQVDEDVRDGDDDATSAGANRHFFKVIRRRIRVSRSDGKTLNGETRLRR